MLLDVDRSHSSAISSRTEILDVSIVTLSRCRNWTVGLYPLARSFFPTRFNLTFLKYF